MAPAKGGKGKAKKPTLRQQVSRERTRKTVIFFSLALVAISYLSYTLIFGDMGLIKYLELRQNRNRIEAEITRIQQENKTLSEQVNSLRKDPYYIEKYAREEYGLAKPNEVIFQFKNDEQR